MDIMIEYDGKEVDKLKLSQSQLKTLKQTGTVVCGKWTITVHEYGVEFKSIKGMYLFPVTGDKKNPNIADTLHSIISKRVISSWSAVK